MPSIADGSPIQVSSGSRDVPHHCQSVSVWVLELLQLESPRSRALHDFNGTIEWDPKLFQLQDRGFELRCVEVDYCCRADAPALEIKSDHQTHPAHIEEGHVVCLEQ
jgi:hypothetical protein